MCRYHVCLCSLQNTIMCRVSLLDVPMLFAEYDYKNWFLIHMYCHENKAKVFHNNETVLMFQLRHQSTISVLHTMYCQSSVCINISYIYILLRIYIPLHIYFEGSCHHPMPRGRITVPKCLNVNTP